MKAKAGGTACAVAYEKPKSQVKKSYECTGAMAVYIKFSINSIFSIVCA